MKDKWDAFMGSAGFYVTMAVCLLIAGISGYFLLFDQETPIPAEEPMQVETPVVSTQEPSIPVIEEEIPPVVETIAPEPVEVPVSMPEVEISSEPIVEEAPRLVVSPLQGEVLTVFSVDTLVYNETLDDWRIHDGIDISAKPGTTVLAACSGTVCAVTDDALMGTTVVIDHAGGYQTTYANLQGTPTVEIGDTVSAGQIIGAVGTTAAAEASQSPHLHFSVSLDGDAVDPNEFLKR